MKILYVITSLGVGGAEKIVSAMADKAFSEGHDVKIVCLTGPVLIKPQSQDVEVIALNMEGYYSLVSAFLRLTGIVRKFKPDVVHGHMVHANIIARLVRLFTYIPILICSAHSKNEGGFGRMLAYRLTNWLGDYLTNVSHEAAAALENAGAAKPGKIISVYNGVDVDVFSCQKKSKESVFTLVAIGRLEIEKDYPTMLNALKILMDYGLTLQLWVVGEGSQKKYLQRYSERMSVSSNVKWLGVRHDIPEILTKADLFILSSAWEGFGLVVAEAMACELPVVATDCGGVREVLGDEHWLVPPGDSEQLAGKIIEMMNLSSAERYELGKKNRMRVISHYSLDAMYENYLKLYQRVI